MALEESFQDLHTGFVVWIQPNLSDETDTELHDLGSPFLRLPFPSLLFNKVIARTYYNAMP